MIQSPGRRPKKFTWLIFALLSLFLAPCQILSTPAPPLEISAESRVSELQAGRASLATGEQTDIRVGVVRVMNTDVPMAYQWNATGGDFIAGQGTCCVTYRAPDMPGTYEVHLALQYGNELIQRSITLTVVGSTPTPSAPVEPTPTSTQVVPANTPGPVEVPLADAAAYYERGQDGYFKRDYQQAIADFSKAIELNYDPISEAYYQRGYMYYVQQDYKPATEDFTRAIELNYDPIGLVYYNRGNAAYYSGNGEQAVADYTRAIELEHQPVSWVYNNRGLAYRKLGAYEQAIADYNKAIELGHDPLHWPYYNRGNAYADMKVYDRAIVDYNEAIRLDPGLVDAYYARGVAYKQLGDAASAAADFQQVVTMDNDYWRQEAEKQLQELAAGG